MDVKALLQKRIEDFGRGEEHAAWEFLGAFAQPDGGALFRVWAPQARAVYLAGNFNGWNPTEHPMAPLAGGIWELTLANIPVNTVYKFVISADDGQTLWKADPYARFAELRPETASVLWGGAGYVWGDAAWLAHRRENPVYENPLCIYEVHAGSWRRRPDGSFLSWGELAEQLIPHVLGLGFTHIELLPVTEYPYDGSWGYQCTGYFAATARHGTPEDLKAFVDACHQAGLGVIFDWVPAHFPKDPHGLVEFDGSRCYENPDSLMGEHPSWGTRIFDYGRGEVRSFLISSALYWLREFHMDGLRVDAVASMLYLDYDRPDGQWRPNPWGGKENLEAVEFLKQLNLSAFAFDESLLMIAEESTAWPGVCAPVYAGGLGFNLKWNMGWMNDSLRYIKTDPYFRVGSHHHLTFSMMYAFSENYVLPLSHDEVVHMKGSIYGKMPGFHRQKLAGIRSFWAYMLAHPGKKLLFMGAELGQAGEWDFASQLDWTGAGADGRPELTDFFRAAGAFYRQTPALWRRDFDPGGFSWLCPDEAAANVLGFVRYDKDGPGVIFLCSFSGSAQCFRLGVPVDGVYETLFSTDDPAFGGGGSLLSGTLFVSGEEPRHGQAQSVAVDLPPLSALFLQIPSPPAGEEKEGARARRRKENDP